MSYKFIVQINIYDAIVGTEAGIFNEDIATIFFTTINSKNTSVILLNCIATSSSYGTYDNIILQFFEKRFLKFMNKFCLPGLLCHISSHGLNQN